MHALQSSTSVFTVQQCEAIVLVASLLVGKTIWHVGHAKDRMPVGDQEREQASETCPQIERRPMATRACLS